MLTSLHQTLQLYDCRDGVLPTHTMGSLQIKKATFSYTMFGVTAHVAGTKPFPYLLEILSYVVIIVSGPL
jgi:hypothetical protein